MVTGRAVGALAFAGAAAGSVALGRYAKRRALAGVEPPPGPCGPTCTAQSTADRAPSRSFDRTRLHVEVLGPEGAPTMVLAHGYALSQHAWHHQRRALCERFRLVCHDQRGHGASAQAVSGDYSMGALGRDLAAVLDATTEPGRPVVAVGHSMGGTTHLSFADQLPQRLERLAGVGLVSSAAGNVLAGGVFSAGTAALSCCARACRGCAAVRACSAATTPPTGRTLRPPTWRSCSSARSA